MSSNKRCNIWLPVCHVKVYCNKWHFGKNVSDLWTLLYIILHKVDVFFKVFKEVGFQVRNVNFGAKHMEVQLRIWRVWVWPASLLPCPGCPGCGELLYPEAVVWDMNGLEWNLFVRALQHFMLILILGALLACAVCHHPQKGEKSCKPSTGLPLATCLLPPGVWEQRGLQEGAAPNLSVKMCFPRQTWRLYLRGGREQACPLYSISYAGVPWLVWEEMEQNRSRGECPSQNREVKSCCLSGRVLLQLIQLFSFTRLWIVRNLLFLFCKLASIFLVYNLLLLTLEPCGLCVSHQKVFGGILVIRRFWGLAKGSKDCLEDFASIAKQSWEVLSNCMPTLPVP